MRLKQQWATITALTLLGHQGISEAREKVFRRQGRIIAYRPAERIRQVASHVLNNESFLFRTEGTNPSVVKLIYEHMGYTTMDEIVLVGAPVLQIKGLRDPACDETFRAFVEHPITLTGDASFNESSKPVVFVGEAKEKLSDQLLLRCYRVAQSDLAVKASH